MRHWIYLFIIVLLSAIPAMHADETLVTRLNSLQVFTGPLDAVDFSPDGGLLASGGRDNTLRIWNATTGAQIRTIAAHDNWVTSLAFSPDGTQIATGSRDNSVRLWDANSGQLLRVIGHHRGDITALAFTPDGKILASGGRDSFIKLYTVHDGAKISELENYGGPVWDVAFSYDGTMLAAAGEDGMVWLWGLWDANGAWIKHFKGHEGPSTRLAFSADDRYLLSGGLDGTLRLWDVTRDAIEITEAELIMRGHLAPIMGLGFASEGKMAATASLDGTVRLWDIAASIERGEEISMISGNGAPLTYLTLNNGRTKAASVGTDGVLNLWDVSENTLAAIIASKQPATLAQSPAVADDTAPSAAVSPEDPYPQPLPTAIRTPIPQPTQPPDAVQPTPIPPQPSIPDLPPASGRAISIPSIGLQSPITTFYLDGRSWAIDPWEHQVGYLQGTAWLDRVGNMALGGHSEYPNGNAGIFKSLYNVGIGDEIFVQEGNVRRRYVVVNIKTVDFRDLSVVYPTSHNRLTLITCDIPSYVAEQNLYYERLVVQADEVPS